MSYNQLAPYYAGIEKLVFGNKLNQARKELLSELPQGLGLVLGGGRGVVSNTLQNFGQTIHYVDSSTNMIHIAKKINPLVHYIHNDAFDFLSKTSNKYDFICLPFFIDLFPLTEQARFLKLCSEKMHPHAKLWVADFQIPTNWFLKIRAEVYIKLMLYFFKYTTGLQIKNLSNWQLQCQIDFVLEKKTTLCGDLITTNIYRLKS